MTDAALNQVLFKRAVDSMPDNALSVVRHMAANKLSRTGLPTVRDEEWRYTNIAPAVNISNTWLADAAHRTSDRERSETPIQKNIDAHWICVRNGQIDLASTSMPNGVSMTLLSGDSANDIATGDPMTQFNAALLPDGLRISIAAGHSVEKPIGILFVDGNVNDANTASLIQSRIIINVGESASASFIEAHAASGNNECFANSVVQLDLFSNSNVEYLRIQQRARNHIQTGKLEAAIADGAKLRHCAIDLGGSLIRSEVVVKLNGAESSVSLNGLYLIGNRQHIDNHTRIDHCVGPSRSEEEYRGILNRKARGIFNGKAVVHRGADGTDAQQSNHNLLLSGDAEIDTKPELEIYADDVKCSHGATVGQVDDAALFYLRSRGLDKKTATQLITRAFAAKVISSMTVDAARDYVSNALNDRLDGLIGDSDHE